MKRGEVYYIQHRHTVGSEQAKGRPAIIVSNDALNATAEVVEVVFLTTNPKKELPTHVGINATGIPSTALCEQITTVSKTLVGDYFGRCSKEEMLEINSALMRSLGVVATVHSQDGIMVVPPLPSLLEKDFAIPKTPKRLDNFATLPYIEEAKRRVQESDPVNHPSHYTDGRIEVIDYIEDKGLGYHLGNAVKYISRAGKKDPTKKVEDLKKAAWYINRELEKLEKEAVEG
jgi:mRNA-degrading endonuclease toxin of MazEF toxin-antitoxin module